MMVCGYYLQPFKTGFISASIGFGVDDYLAMDIIINSFKRLIFSIINSLLAISLGY